MRKKNLSELCELADTPFYKEMVIARLERLEHDVKLLQEHNDMTQKVTSVEKSNH